MNTNFHTESRMREICTYGSMRGRAYPTRGVPLYSTLERYRYAKHKLGRTNSGRSYIVKKSTYD